MKTYAAIFWWAQVQWHWRRWQSNLLLIDDQCCHRLPGVVVGFPLLELGPSQFTQAQSNECNRQTAAGFCLLVTRAAIPQGMSQVSDP